MMLVCSTYGNNYFSHFQIHSLTEFFINPELFKSNLTTFFCLCFIFTRFVGIQFDSRFSSAMFKFNLTSHGPTMTEIITDIYCYVRQIESAVTVIVLMILRACVPIYIITIEIT